MESSRWEFPLRTEWMEYKLGARPPGAVFAL